MPMQYTENFRDVKIEKFYWKKIDIFNMFAHIINHSVYPSVCRTDGYGTDRRLQEHALFRAKNVFPFF